MGLEYVGLSGEWLKFRDVIPKTNGQSNGKEDEQSSRGCIEVYSKQ